MGDPDATSEALKRTRAWRQMASQAMLTPTAAQDSMLRLGLAAMAADPASSLTPGERQWVIDLVQWTGPLTQDERMKLKDPLLRWMEKTMPRCVALMKKQFAEKEVVHEETHKFD